MKTDDFESSSCRTVRFKGTQMTCATKSTILHQKKDSDQQDLEQDHVKSLTSILIPLNHLFRWLRIKVFFNPHHHHLSSSRIGIFEDEDDVGTRSFYYGFDSATSNLVGAYRNMMTSRRWIENCVSGPRTPTTPISLSPGNSTSTIPALTSPGKFPIRYGRATISTASPKSV